jgi:hypothetical protein
MTAEKWKEIKMLKKPVPKLIWGSSKLGTYNIGRNKAKRKSK